MDLRLLAKPLPSLSLLPEQPLDYTGLQSIPHWMCDWISSMPVMGAALYRVCAGLRSRYLYAHMIGVLPHDLAVVAHLRARRESINAGLQEF